MTTKPRSFSRPCTLALVVAAVVAAGAAVVAGPADAVLPVPKITSVFVAGSTTNRVVTNGTTVRITGTGLSGMVDNSADPACSATPVASSRCSQVRFNGLSANADATGYTLASRYVVVSDTQIYATVPTIAALAPATGAPAAGTGSIRVVVVNTAIGAGSSLASDPGTTTATELLYRHPLGAALVNSSVAASPVGGGTIAVDVTNITALTSGGIAAEKISAYFTSVVDGSPSVVATSVTFNDSDTVNVVVPPGTPAGDFVGVMLVHDGVLGTADSDSLKYPALVTKVETCGSFVPPVTTVLPVCTGPANTGASPIHAKLTGKGLAGATNFEFGGSDGVTQESCSVMSDTLVYCRVVVGSVPSSPVVAVTFTPADLDGAGPATAPAYSAIGAGGIFGFYD